MSSLLVFYPDYRVTNDYQSMLYSALKDSMRVIAGTIDSAADAAVNENQSQTIFHLHWPEPIFQGVATQGAFRRRAEEFTKKVRYFQAAGGCFLWTIHNKLPHDRLFSFEYKRFFQCLASIADGILLHSSSAVRVLDAELKIHEEKVHVIPHGSYIGVYPSRTSRQQARERLSIPSSDFVIGFIGQLRPYKGLEKLVSAFRQLNRENGSVRLLIAGKPVYPTKPGFWQTQSTTVNGLHVYEGFIPTSDLSLYHAACDVICLPYEDILTSGSLMLAASFGKPVVIPDLDAFTDLADLQFVWQYDAGDIRSLSQTLRNAMALPEYTRQQANQAAYDYAARYSWANSASMFSDLISSEGIFMSNLEQINSKTVKTFFPRFFSKRKIAVCIVDFYSYRDTQRLCELLAEGEGNQEINIFICDNSEDEFVLSQLRRLLPSAVVVKPAENLGYAGGNNLLIELARRHEAEQFMIVNPDMTLKARDVLSLSSQLLVHPDSILSPLILKDADVISFGGAFFVDGLDLEVLHHLDGQHRSTAGVDPYQVDALNGCALFFSYSTFERVGKISEDFFLYYEETDWFVSARSKNIHSYIVPSIVAYHAKASHGDAVPSLYYLYYLMRGSALFARKHGRDIRGAQERMQGTFVKGWRDKLTKSAPSFLATFETISRLALDDGYHSITGKVNIGERSDAYVIPDAEIVGFVEEHNIHRQSLIGWAALPIGQERDIKNDGIWLLINDKPLSYQSPTIDRQDVEAAGYYKKAGFEVFIPQEFATGEKIKIEIRLSRTGARLPFTFANFNREVTISVLPPKVLDSEPKLEGRIEGVKDNVLSGWAWDKENPHRSVYVKLRYNHSILDIGFAELFREDLRRSGKGGGKHGFRVVVPKEMLRHSQIAVELLDETQELVISKRDIQIVKPSNGFDDSMSLDGFFRWSFIDDRMPVGAFDHSVTLQETLAALYQQRALAALSLDSRALVSVVMPVYNRVEIFEVAVDSVRKQSYPNWELIIVDDGSIDGTVNRLRKYLEEIDDSRIIVLFHDQNRGVSSARNTALASARGEFICYLDSDNSWKPHTLSIMVDELQKNPSAITAYAGQEIWERIAVTGNRELRFVRVSPFNRSRLEQKNFIDLNVFMHRRTCLQVYGNFREDMRRLVDWELILRYTSDLAPQFLPVLLSEYNVGEVSNQITAVENYQKARETLQKTLSAGEQAADDGNGSVGQFTVIVFAPTIDDVQAWASANGDWLLKHRPKLYRLYFDGSAKVIEVKDVEILVLSKRVLHSGTATSIDEIIKTLDPDCAIMLITQEIALVSGWEIGLRVGRAAECDIVSGRVLRPAKSQGQTSLDIMPEAIVKDVVRWTLPENVLGQEVKSLPFFWMWAFPKASAILLAAIAAAGSPNDVVRHVRLTQEMNNIKLAYLPQISSVLIL